MTDLAWTDLRRQAIQTFNGELPHAQTEQELIDAFEQNAGAVQWALREVSEAFANGTVRSGWAVWKARVATVHANREAVADISDERERKVRHAEQWVRNVAVHYDRETEVEDELFGELGRLRDYTGDETLRTRLLRQWADQRPRGQRCETAAEERAAKWKTDMQRIADAARKETVNA